MALNLSTENTNALAFSAIDMQVSFRYPHQTPVHAGNLKAISISTHRDVFPVMSLGSVRPRGFTRGPRTIAGTLVFSVLNINPVPSMTASQKLGGLFNSNPDQYPPFDITIIYISEEGNASIEVIKGVVLLDMGKAMSTESIEINEQYSYMAEDYLPLIGVAELNTKNAIVNVSSEAYNVESSTNATMAFSSPPGLQLPFLRNLPK